MNSVNTRFTPIKPMTVFLIKSTLSDGMNNTTIAQIIGIRVISDRIGNPKLFIDYIPPNIGMACHNTITRTAKNITNA